MTAPARHLDKRVAHRMYDLGLQDRGEIAQQFSGVPILHVEDVSGFFRTLRRYPPRTALLGWLQRLQGGGSIETNLPLPPRKAEAAT
ncbi:MAG: hypothetical protein ACRDYA_19095 [Egibacteraceae bacterium]